MARYPRGESGSLPADPAVDIIDLRFAGSVERHRDGGHHLDVFKLDSDLRTLVGDDDLRLYESEQWLEFADDDLDRCPPPTEPRPRADPDFWLDDTLASSEQWAAFRYLGDGPHRGAVLQIGGRGTSLVRWMAASGRIGILLSPFDGELDYGRRLAAEAGVVDQLITIAAPAEAIPLRTDSVDTIFARGVIHHTQVELAMAEVARVLTPNGRFASWDVWNSPLYRLGIALMGKSEIIQCQPMEPARLSQLPTSLDVSVSYGGGITRYLVAGLSRCGITLSLGPRLRLGQFDRLLCRLLPLHRFSASMVSILARKPAATGPLRVLKSPIA